MSSHLRGVTVLLTRQAPENSLLAEALARDGAETIALPCIRIEHLADSGELAAALRALGADDWLVLTSRYAVDAVLRAVRPDELRARIAVVGPATAHRCAESGLVTWRPSRPDGSRLARELPFDRGAVLHARADIADGALARELRTRGARVGEVVAYRTVIGAAGDVSDVRRRLESGAVAVVAFFSPSAVDGLLAAVSPHLVARTRIVAAGVATARRVLERLGQEAITAEDTRTANVAGAIERAARDHERSAEEVTLGAPR
jgi:uroporphyrinogen-III synthase